jgi:hypothetical protein
MPDRPGVGWPKVDPLGTGERASRLVDAPGDLGMDAVFLISGKNNKLPSDLST